MHRPLALLLVVSTAAATVPASPSSSGTPIVVTVEARRAPEGLVAWLFSPDWSMIVGFRGTDERAPETICLFDAVTGDERWCVDGSPGVAPVSASPTCMPDGSAFVLTEGALDEPDLWRLDAATGEATNLTDDGNTMGRSSSGMPRRHRRAPRGSNWLPRFAPDGSAIAFLRTEMAGGASGPTRVMVMPPTGGQPVAVAQVRPLPNEGVSWSPDGSRLHWTLYGADDRQRVESVGVDGREPRSAALSVDGSVEPVGGWPYRIDAVLADGRLLMSDSCFFTCAYWLVDPRTGIAERFPPGVTADPDLRPIVAAASPDGGRTALLFRRSDGPHLEIHDLVDGAVLEVSGVDLEDATQRARLRWLPDGRIALTTARFDPVAYVLLTLPEARR